MSKKEVSKSGIKGKTNSVATDDSIAIASDKVQFIGFFLIICLSIMFYYISVQVLQSVYNPDINQALTYAKNILCVGGYSPEPQEKVLFILGILVFTLSFFGLLIIFNRIKHTLKAKAINPLYYSLLILCLAIIAFFVYKGFSAQNPYFDNIQNSHDTNKSNWDFYFTGTFLYSNLSIFSFIIFPLILFALIKANFQKQKNQGLTTLRDYSIYLFCLLIIIILFFITAFKFPYTFENKYDFNAVFYSVVQVYHGMPMLVNNFTNIYGLYPHFVVPILKITGLSVFSFTFIMATLLAACFVFLVLILKKQIDNKWLLLFGFTSIFFNSYMYFRIATPYDNVFSMSPIRWILIFSLLFYASMYATRKSRLLYHLSFLIFSIGILWNPEVGMLCYLSLISYYCFLDLELGNFKQIAVRWGITIATAIITLLATIVGYELLIKLFYGQFPDFLKMFSTIQVFSSIGMGMLPMPKGFHPYMLIAAVYLIGLLVSINNILRGKITAHTSFIFILTVFGILFFVYYVGRSHNWNLFVSNPLAFILLTLFADDLLKIIKTNKAFIPLLAVVLYAISFSVFQTVYSYKQITDLVLEKDNKQINQDANNEFKTNAEFIKNLSDKNEKVMILTAVHLQGLYHCYSNTASAFNPGFVELYFRTDYERLLSLLDNQPNLKVFFEPKYFRFSDLRILNRLTASFDLKQNNGSIFYFQKRTVNKNAKALLPSNEKIAFHQILDGSISTMEQYALGKNAGISLGKQFTIEVVLKPNSIPQTVFTQSATVFSNISANKGLILRQNDTIQNQYIFGFANRGIICKVEMNKWNYLVFVVDEKKISCFVNGVLFGIVESDTPYVNSLEPFYIGSQNLNPGFFFGNLKELKIANRLIDTKEIAGSWKSIQENLSKQ